MSERWIPLLAAVVGLLGGMGGAFVGGWVANEGQQDRFESERTAQIQQLRRGTFAAFLSACARQIDVGGDEGNVRATEAEVSLVSSTAVREAAGELLKACTVQGYITPERRASYTEKRNMFVDLAQPDLGIGD